MQYVKRRVPVIELHEGDLCNPPLMDGTIVRITTRRMEVIEDIEVIILIVETLEGNLREPMLHLHPDTPVNLLEYKTKYVSGMSGRDFVNSLTEQHGVKGR